MKKEQNSEDEKLNLLDEEVSLAEEAGLDPKSWRPIDAPALRPSQASVPNQTPNPMAPYFGGVINPGGQLQPYLVGTQYGSPMVAKLPLWPVSQSGSPTGNSGIQSTSTPIAVGASNNATAAAFNT